MYIYIRVCVCALFIYIYTHSILALLISHSRNVPLQLGHEVSLPVIFMSGDQPEKTKDVMK
jgi:hypothetical protein